MADEAVADTPVETPVAPVEQSSESLRAEMHADLAATSTPAPEASVTVSEGADPTQAAQPEWRSVRDILPELGFAADGYVDDQSALQDLAVRANRVAELEQQNRHFQYLLQQAQQPPAPAPAPVQQAAPQPTVQPFLPKIPDFDQRWMRLLEKDEAGRIVAVPGADPTLPQKYQEWNQGREEALNKLVSSPEQFAEWVYQQTQSKRDQEFEAKIEARLAQERHAIDAVSYIRQNAPKLYQLGPNGLPLRDPTTGQEALSQYGHTFLQGLHVAEQLQLPVAHRKVFAETHARAAELEQQLAAVQQQLAAGKVPTQAAAPAQQPTAQQRKDDFINKNRGQARKPNRNGTIAATRDGVDQNDRLSLREALRQDFAEAGFSVRN